MSNMGFLSTTMKLELFENFRYSIHLFIINGNDHKDRLDQTRNSLCNLRINCPCRPKPGPLPLS